MKQALAYGFTTGLIAITLTTPALAGVPAPGVPGPVVGLGIPALAAFAFAYRRLRSRDRG